MLRFVCLLACAFAVAQASYSDSSALSAGPYASAPAAISAGSYAAAPAGISTGRYSAPVTTSVGSQWGGLAYQLQPAMSVQCLPTQNAYAPANAYGAGIASAPYNIGATPLTGNFAAPAAYAAAPIWSNGNLAATASPAIDAQCVGLSQIALSLPGLPASASLNDASYNMAPNANAVAPSAVGTTGAVAASSVSNANNVASNAAY